MHDLKKVVTVVFILSILLMWQSVGYAQQISQPITYQAEITPFGSEIRWEPSFPPKPEDPDAHRIGIDFKFLLSPGTVTANFIGDVIFDQGNKTISIQSKPSSRFQDRHGNQFTGQFHSDGGFILTAELFIDLEIPLPGLPNVLTINYSVEDVPELPELKTGIEKGWDETELLDSLLLNSESATLRVGVPNLLGETLTADQVATFIITAATHGATAAFADHIRWLITEFLGTAGMSTHVGFEGDLTLAAEAISINGTRITREGQSIPAPGLARLDPSADSYNVNSVFYEDFTYTLDYVSSIDIFAELTIGGLIPFWEYPPKDEDGNRPPLFKRSANIIPDLFDGDYNMRFLTLPDTLTFPITGSRPSEPPNPDLEVPSPDSSEAEWMPDANLRARVRTALGLQPGEALTQQAMQELTFLNASSAHPPIASEQITDLTGLEYATQLIELGLSDNRISDLSPLADLTSLQSLWLPFNQVSDISVLEDLTALWDLDLDSNQISDISVLEDLTALIALDLSGNQINDISVLEDLTALIGLGLSANQISDISALEDLTALTRLFFAGNQISDISALEDLTALTYLDIINNQISDISVLEDLTALTVLYLSGNQISDISALEDLTALTVLDLGGNQISDISVLEDLTALTRLYLSGNQISDISALEDLTALTQLYLENNQISNISALDDLTLLTDLGLFGNQISDISALEDLTALTLLSLGNNQISDISVLEELTLLRYLDLNSNQISDVGPLEGLTSLTELYISGNPITDLAPLQTLKANNPGVEIDIDINVPGAPTVPVILPTETILFSNYPNPFNPETWIPYQLAKPADVTLTLYDMTGIAVRQLALGYQPAGIYKSRSRAAHWDGRNAIGERVASGIYFYMLTAGDFTTTKKMLILK